MESILQGLLELPGVNAAMVVDDGGRLIAHRGRAVYDAQLCEQVSATLARAVDSIQLQHEDWESLSAQFADGKLLVRNLGVLGAGGPCVLVLAADLGLNVSFATVAIRVAANKLRKLADPTARSPLPSAPPVLWQSAASWPTSPASPPPPLPSTTSGLRPPPSMPTRATPGVAATPDPAAVAFLVRCTRELARQVGPMARVFVDEAVRRISPGQPFALAASRALLEDLAAQIEDPAGRTAFLASITRR
jgi:predicted regulator of Ras-like GTPase activity (Roadblock/LC7/MglB family)